MIPKTLEADCELHLKSPQSKITRKLMMTVGNVRELSSGGVGAVLLILLILLLLGLF